MIEYKKKYEIEKRRNKLLVIAIILILLGFIILSLKLYQSEREKENLCYMSNALIDLANDMKKHIGVEFEDLKPLTCYSGNAERRLT